MKNLILFFTLVFISFSCDQGKDKTNLKEESEQVKKNVYNSQIIKKVKDFFLYQEELDDKFVVQDICKIEFFMHDPYHISPVIDTFICISPFYCERKNENYKGVIIIKSKKMVIYGKDELISEFCNSFELVQLPLDSLYCIDKKIKTKFTYIVKNDTLREWIYPFNY